MTGGFGGWVPPGGGASSLDGLSDVDTSSSPPSDGDVLIYDSASGLWVPGTGASGSLTYLNEVELASAAADITFSSIPTTYRDLIVVGELRLTNAGNSHDLHIQVGNGSVDTGANYVWGVHYADMAVTSNAGGASRAAGSSGRIWQPVASGGSADHFSTCEARFLEYANTSRPRRIGASWQDYYRMGDGWTKWQNSAAAIDTIKFFNPSGGNLAAGSRLALYGRG